MFLQQEKLLPNRKKIGQGGKRCLGRIQHNCITIFSLKSTINYCFQKYHAERSSMIIYKYIFRITIKRTQS